MRELEDEHWEEIEYDEEWFEEIELAEVELFGVYEEEEWWDEEDWIEEDEWFEEIWIEEEEWIDRNADESVDAEIAEGESPVLAD